MMLLEACTDFLESEVDDNSRKSEMLYEHIVTRYHSTWCVPPGGTVIACYTCSPVPQSSSTGKTNAHIVAFQDT